MLVFLQTLLCNRISYTFKMNVFVCVWKSFNNYIQWHGILHPLPTTKLPTFAQTKTEGYNIKKKIFSRLLSFINNIKYYSCELKIILIILLIPGFVCLLFCHLFFVFSFVCSWFFKRLEKFVITKNSLFWIICG